MVVMVVMGQDNLWNSEGTRGPTQTQVEKRNNYPAIHNPLFNLSLCRYPGTRGRRSTTLCSLLFERQFCPIIKGGADHLGSQPSVLLRAIPEAVLSHTRARRISFIRSQTCTSTQDISIPPVFLSFQVVLPINSN